MTRTLRLGNELRVAVRSALAILVGLALITLLRGTFRPFGFLMDALLILIVLSAVFYLWMLWKRPGRGPASENVDDVLRVARANLDQGELCEEEYRRIKENTED
jgi:uncharacterized membrane protein